MNSGTRLHRRGEVLLSLVLLLLGWGNLAAQPPTVPSGPGTPSAPNASPPAMPLRAADVQNVKPDVYYMRDANGELVLVPDFSWDEFHRLLLQDLRLQGPAPPPVVLERVALTGSADGAVAQIEVRLELQLTRAAETPVRVPLQLATAILQDSRYEGSGEAILAFDEEANSYVCWLRGAEQSQHIVTLTMAVRLRQIGDDTRFELQLPNASTHIEMTVAVPNVEVQVGSEQYVVKPTTAAPQGGSLISVDGMGGELRLDWRSGQRAADPVQPLISANATVTLNVNDDANLLAQLQLEVRAERGTLSSFHIELPPGMKLMVPGDAAGYTLQVEEPEEGNTDAPQVVRVDLASTRTPAASIQFSAAAARSPDRALEPFEIVGFSVKEAFHQRTDVLIAVEGDWSVRVVEMQNVRRAGSLSDADRERGVVRKFVYYQNPTQSNSLQLAIQPQESMVNVEPIYVLRVREQLVRLDAVLRLRVRGAAARNIPLRFAGWSLTDIQPADLVPTRPEILGEGDLEPALVIPLEDSRVPRNQTFELRLSAERRIDEGEDKLGIELPLPLSGRQLPDQTLLVEGATVVVVAAESMELQPLTSEMPDLYSVAQNTVPELPADLQDALTDMEPLVFQSAAASDTVRFVARVRPRPQTIMARSDAEIRFEGTDWHVRQTLHLTVAHQPLQTIPLAIDPQLVKNGRLLAMATLGDEALAVTEAPSPAGGPPRHNLLLPAPRVGPFEIVFTYRITPPRTSDDRSVAARVPLVSLSNDLAVTRAATEVTLQSDGTWQGIVEGDEWTRVEADTTTGHRVRVERLATEVNLRVGPSSENAIATTVHEAWVQSAFMDDRRLDRAVFRISTSEPRVTVLLPSRTSLDPQTLSVAVDGRKAELQIGAESELQIELPPADDVPRRVVEVWYSFLPRYPAAGDMRIEVAQLQGRTRWARYYWQLVTPIDEHLVWDPMRLTPESDWMWTGWSLERVPHMDQQALETALGAVRAEALPEQVNSYLFSTFGELPRIRIITAPRALVVLVASGVVLLAGLALIYVSWLRQPGVLLLLGVATLGLGYAQPTVGLVAAQAAAAGLLLCLVAVVMDRLFAPPRAATPQVRSTIVSADSARVDGGPAPSTPPTAAAAAPLSTTATGPFPVEMSSAEVEP